MIYAFFKVWTNWVIRLFFRKIYTEGLENVPKDKALLISSNHPNGFIEPITMACIFNRPLHFLVRGDVFKPGIAQFFLEKTNQIPIFRFKDGFENLRKNNKSIEITLKKLQAGSSILIFVEGGTKAMKTLRPLQKGLARIAFQVLEKDPKLDLDVLPVGINYLDNRKFRSESILSVGEPLSANEYYEKYKDNVNIGIKQLKEDSYDAMKNHVIHLDDIKDTDLLNNLLLLSNVKAENNVRPVVQSTTSVLTINKGFANYINKQSVESKSQWLSESNAIIKKYGRAHLTNRYHSSGSVSGNALWVILLSVPALIGLVINAIPFFGARLLAVKTAGKSIFYMSIWLTGMSLLGSFFYFVGLIVCTVIFGWKGLLLLFGVPLFTITMRWLDKWNELRSQLALGNNHAKEDIDVLFRKLK